MKAIVFASTILLSAPALAVSGDYVSECIPLENASIVQEAQYLDGEFFWNQKVFGDLECATPIYDMKYLGTYKLGEESKIDYVFNQVTITPVLDQVASTWNENKLCGLDAWALDVSSDVTGLECGGQTMITEGTEYFDIIQETETGILLGLPSEELDGSSDEKRPEEFDTVELTKVEVEAPEVSE